MLKNVAAVVLNDFSPFELGVICEVFGSDRSDDGLPAYDFAVVAGEPGPLRSEAGFTLDTPYDLERIKQADLIVPQAKEDGGAVTFERPALSSEYVAPRNDVEKTLRNYDVLQLEPRLQPLYRGDDPTINAILQATSFNVRQPLGLTHPHPLPPALQS